MIRAPQEVAQMLEFEETLTPEEILLRFKKLFGRDMTSQEMGCFLFPCQLTPDSAPDKKLAPMPATHF